MKIPIVNEKDEIVDYKERKDSVNTDITRVTGLWITDPEGSILLTQRALNKRHSPGLWGPAVAGTVEENETYESNIIKEAEEEIGLKNIKPIIGPKYRKSTSHEYFVQWFVLKIPQSTNFKVQKEEVENIKWFSKEEIEKLLKEKPGIFTPNLHEYYKNFLDYENKN